MKKKNYETFGIFQIDTTIRFKIVSPDFNFGKQKNQCRATATQTQHYGTKIGPT